MMVSGGLRPSEPPPLPRPSASCAACVSVNFNVILGLQNLKIYKVTFVLTCSINIDINIGIDADGIINHFLKPKGLKTLTILTTLLLLLSLILITNH